MPFIACLRGLEISGLHGLSSTECHFLCMYVVESSKPHFFSICADVLFECNPMSAGVRRTRTNAAPHTCVGDENNCMQQSTRRVPER